MWQTTWFAGADVQWAPIYGKISRSPNTTSTSSSTRSRAAVPRASRASSTTRTYDAPQVRFSANYGLGVRLIPWKYVALRAEIRNYNGLNPNVEEHEDRDEGACSNGYTLVVGADRQCFPDISNNTMLQVGLSLIL